MKRTSHGPSLAIAALALGSLSACGSADSSSAIAPSAPAPVGSTPNPSASTDSTSSNSSAGGSCPSGAASKTTSPVADAKAARDVLLTAVCTAPYDGQQSADLVITKQWQQVAPNLTPGLFSDSAATPTTIASSGGFLLDYGHTMDQYFAFAVTDGTACSGGVAVIPQAGAGKASDTKKPTQFASVDVPAGQSCTAQTVQNTYRPGSVHP
ncbi:MAG TPA: hypothetical protein VLR26_03985 [Frankiaceae bacterium]|nr:hypothetical protein [Frankiaceae bacterium]